MESLADFKRLEQCFSFVSVFPFEATPSSCVGREPERFGLVADAGSATGQSQFAANHLAVRDPAMSDEERRQVFIEYRAFAARVNERKAMDRLVSTGRDEAIRDSRLRLADELFDFTPLDGGIQCFNWLTKERFAMPQECRVLIERMRARRSFTRDEFLGWFPVTSMGEFYFDRMAEKGMLAIVEPPDRAPGG